MPTFEERFRELRGDPELGKYQTEAESLRKEIERLQKQAGTYNANRDNTTTEVLLDFYRFTRGESHPIEEEYGRAVKILEGKEHIKPEGDVIHILREMDTSNRGGLFLSALLNCTDMDTLVIEYFPRLQNIGYRIKEGKTLILGERTFAEDVGEEGEGVILSWGNVKHLGKNARSGFQGNWGYAGEFAEGASGGVQVNWDYAGGFGKETEGGIQVNCGSAKDFADYAKGGVQVNWGVANYLGHRAEDGIQVNRAYVINMFHETEGGIQVNVGKVIIYPEMRKKKVKEMDTKLDLDIPGLGSELPTPTNPYPKLSRKTKPVFPPTYTWRSVPIPSDGTRVEYNPEKPGRYKALNQAVEETAFLSKLKTASREEILEAIAQFDSISFIKRVEEGVKHLRTKEKE